MTESDGRQPYRLVDGLYATSATTRALAAAGVEVALATDRVIARSGMARPVVFVSGFWRSGTTWLQEMLAAAFDAKTVFEPLSPLHPPRRTILAKRFGSDEDAAQAYIPGGSEEGDDILHLLDRAMAGSADSVFGLSCRMNVREATRRRVVVKDVRAQAKLASIHARYRVPVVHLRRHPCAAVSSLIRAHWHWSFGRVSLDAVFPASAVAVPGVAPAELDRDELSRIAFAWAWSERCAATALDGQSWGRIVAYEDLVREPKGTFSRLCQDLGLRPRHDVAFNVPSASIAPAEFARRGGNPEPWLRHLSPEDAARVERIATAVFPRWHKDLCWSTS